MVSYTDQTVLAQTRTRGFSVAEFEGRTSRAQELMAAVRLDALLLTTESDFRYFSGFNSQFWESPTRPWFLLLPASGKPIAVIPEIGAAGMRETWIDTIHTWMAPQPEDDGISLLTRVISGLPLRFGRIGLPLGHESHLRMPAANFLLLRENLGSLEFVDAQPLIQHLQMVKSEAEIEKIRAICEITSNGFEALQQKISIGMTEREICKVLTLDILGRGADRVPFLIGASGHGAYDNIIMGPTDRVLEDGDVMIIDTGSVFDGYFSDFDRNYAFGHVADETRRAYDVVYRATDAGFETAKPGATLSQVFEAMWKVLEMGGALGNDVGRLGHGLGMQLTEAPSVRLRDETVLVPGMVITLEPGMAFAPGKTMVHEENIVITEYGAEWLSRRAPSEMPVIHR